MTFKVGDFVERKRPLEPPAVAWRDDPWERGEVEGTAVGRVRIKAAGDSVWRRADDFALVERPAVPFGAHGGESREVRDARDRWAWFSDAELLALRGVVMRGESEWAPNPVQAALYREVCAAIDARPSCVLRAAPLVIGTRVQVYAGTDEEVEAARAGRGETPLMVLHGRVGTVGRESAAGKVGVVLDGDGDLADLDRLRYFLPGELRGAGGAS